MKKLIEAKNTISFLKAHDISAKKRYGQNFLIDEHVLCRIIEGSGITKEDTVLEIGPGIGTLTQVLCERAGHVIAVEIDKDMIPLLNENLSEYDNYELINEDILKINLAALLGENKKAKVVANLPYYITTPIIMQLLENKLPIESITIMVQKEVADRMQAKPGGKDYGALTLAVRYYSQAEVIASVPPSCFIPRPGVDSAVIRLSCYDKPPVQAKDEEKLFEIIKAAFAQRRKTLANALKNYPKLCLSRERVEAALTEIGLNADIRGEKLSLTEFAELTDLLFPSSGDKTY